MRAPLCLGTMVGIFVAILGISFQSHAQTAGLIGPDVTVSDTFAPIHYGAVGGVSGYAVSTTSCNEGDVAAEWFRDTNAHPLIGVQLYRLQDGRLDQIGMSWLKHAFCAVNETSCGDCQLSDCDTLGVGCADTYSTVNNADQTRLGPRSEVNAATGAYTYPFTTQGQSGSPIYKRLQVHNDNLDPALNVGASYFLEIHYVTTDEPAWGTHYNNTSTRRIFVGDFDNGGWDLEYSIDHLLERHRSAIHLWQASDPEVHLAEEYVDNDGLLILGSKAFPLPSGETRFQYTLYNMNSHRSAASLTIPLAAGVQVSDISFHDVDYHSGEPFDGSDWQVTVTPDALQFSTTPFATNPLANAVRWSTSYTFGFTANARGTLGSAQIGLFRPGTPDAVEPSAWIPDVPGQFVRGDCDESGSVSFTDALTFLGVLFTGATPPRCLSACDFDDSGKLQLADGVLLLSYLFLAGSPPPEPFPNAGQDPTADNLVCF